MIRRSLAVAVLTASLAGCIGFTGDPTAAPLAASPSAGTPAPSPTGQHVSLTIFAAASLRGVLDRMKPAYETANPGVTLTISTDSSAALRTQIEEGAPVDVFLSADTANAEKLASEGLALEDVTYFAATTLTVVTPADNPGGVASPFDLAKPGLRIIAAGDDVPISTYARQVVAQLAAAPGAPPGFTAAYAANVVSKEDNVRAVVAKIELGEGDAALVYEPDAMASTRVHPVAIPPELNAMAVDAGVVLADSPNVPAARAFLSWLHSREGGRFLVDAGFFIPPA